MVEIVYPSAELIPGFHECLGVVARERVYLEMVEAPPLEKLMGFQMSLISQQGPIFYAVDEGRVVGWCDIFPLDNPRHRHRGSLGMGLLPGYRGQGLGTRLLEATLMKAREFGLEKVELQVYTSNVEAIALYKKCGFVQEGLIRNYRKLDGQTFDSLMMAKFLV